MGRRGATLSDTLVALGIVVLLLALTLPALVMARQHARRAQQQSKFRAMGQAVRNYHDIHQRFPAGGSRKAAE
jgi:type II secretory pathway pseudopilin PulG